MIIIAFVGNVTTTDIDNDIQSVFDFIINVDTGHVADYIPALGKVDPALFGIFVVTVDGEIYCVGDTDVPFAIESISKVFALALALEDVGLRTILQKVGAYQTGLPFNSIITSDVRSIKLQNPLVNAGALVTTSYISGVDANDKWDVH